MFCLAVKWESVVNLAAMLRSVEEIPSTANQPGANFSHFTAKQYTTRWFWKHLRREIGINSNRILIHIWSAQPSLTVWLEFGSDWQLPPLNEQPIGTLDFLKPENRAMRRSRRLVFSQSTWITICWKHKHIITFFPQWCKKYSAYCRFNVSPVLFLLASLNSCSEKGPYWT